MNASRPSRVRLLAVLMAGPFVLLLLGLACFLFYRWANGGISGWMAKVDTRSDGTMALDKDFLVEFDEGIRPHQVRLEGGDASSDSFCFS